jgi:hypothetical protein
LVAKFTIFPRAQPEQGITVVSTAKTSDFSNFIISSNILSLEICHHLPWLDQFHIYNMPSFKVNNE